MQDSDVDIVVGAGGVGLCGCEDHAADNIVGVFSLHLVLQHSCHPLIPSLL